MNSTKIYKKELWSIFSVIPSSQYSLRAPTMYSGTKQNPKIERKKDEITVRSVDGRITYEHLPCFPSVFIIGKFIQIAEI